MSGLLYTEAFILQKVFNSLTEKLNSLISYISGFYSGKLKDAGCDSFSLFTGGIYMSSLAPYFYSVKNIKKAENLLEYSKNILSLQIKDQEKSLADFSDYRFSIEDIEKFSCVVPSYELIQTGDILINYKNPNSHLGIILKSGKSKNEILILTVEEKNRLWKLVLKKITVYRSQDDELSIHLYPNLPQ